MNETLNLAPLSEKLLSDSGPLDTTLFHKMMNGDNDIYNASFVPLRTNTQTGLWPTAPTIIGLPKLDPLRHNNHLEDYMERERKQTDNTLLGFNYMGPGTHVVNNLINHVQPVNIADYNSMIHDFEYLTAQSLSDVISADLNFGAEGKAGSIIIPPTDNLSKVARLMLNLKNTVGATSLFWTKGNNDLDSEDIEMLQEELNKIRESFNNSS